LFAPLSCLFEYRALSYFEVAPAVRLRFASISEGCRLKYIDEGKKALFTVNNKDWSLRERYILLIYITPAIILWRYWVLLSRCDSLGGGCIYCECWLCETPAIRSRFVEWLYINRRSEEFPVMKKVRYFYLYIYLLEILPSLRQLSEKGCFVNYTLRS
jgi:hypothetical protein